MKKLDNFFKEIVTYSKIIYVIIALFILDIFLGLLDKPMDSNDFLSLCTTIIISYTAIYAYRQYSAETFNRRVSKGADLAKSYADEVLMPIIEICKNLSNIFNKDSSGKNIESLFNRIDLNKIKDFDEEELCEYLKKDEITTILQLLSIKVDYNEKTVEFCDIFRDALNKMEYFCIYFNSGVAEENTVYQSLHQTFFYVIRYLYPFISVLNKRNDGFDKYYTNIISTYNRWRNLYKEKKEEVERENDKIEKKVDRENKKRKEKEIKLKNKKKSGVVPTPTSK